MEKRRPRLLSTPDQLRPNKLLEVVFYNFEEIVFICQSLLKPFKKSSSTISRKLYLFAKVSRSFSSRFSKKCAAGKLSRILKKTPDSEFKKKDEQQFGRTGINSFVLSRLEGWWKRSRSWPTAIRILGNVGNIAGAAVWTSVRPRKCESMINAA